MWKTITLETKVHCKFNREPTQAEIASVVNELRQRAEDAALGTSGDWKPVTGSTNSFRVKGVDCNVIGEMHRLQRTDYNRTGIQPLYGAAMVESEANENDER